MSYYSGEETAVTAGVIRRTREVPVVEKVTKQDKGSRGYRERNSTSDRTLDILGLFTPEHYVIKAAELAEQFDMARSTAYRYLQTLTSTGFLEECPGGYRLGLRVIELAHIARRAYGPDEVFKEVLERLAHESGETALLARRSGADVVCLETALPAHQHLRVSYERGAVLTLNAGAAAEVLLAWEPETEVADLLRAAELPRYTPNSLTTVPEMVQRLAEIRSAGLAVTRAELDPHAIGVAAPIWRNGKVFASVSVAAVDSRISDTVLASLIAQVRQAGEVLSQRVAYFSDEV